MPKSENITWSKSHVSREQREALLGQRGCVVWFTGLSGSGKSTLSRLLEARLIAAGRLAFVLDGDNLRHGLNKDLGFSAEDRAENIRRIGEVASLMSKTGAIVITAFISPYQTDRAAARALDPERFIEVYCDVPVAVCEQRDPKGLYAKARAGEIKNFTGIDAPYEIPVDPDIAVDTGALEPAACIDIVMAELERRGLLKA